MGHNQEAEPLGLHSQAGAWERVQGVQGAQRAHEHNEHNKQNLLVPSLWLLPGSQSLAGNP